MTKEDIMSDVIAWHQQAINYDLKIYCNFFFLSKKSIATLKNEQLGVVLVALCLLLVEEHQKFKTL